jgi:hypothetical protein
MNLLLQDLELGNLRSSVKLRIFQPNYHLIMTDLAFKVLLKIIVVIHFKIIKKWRK